jgi:hypothetical protein
MGDSSLVFNRIWRQMKMVVLRVGVSGILIS